MNGLKDSKYKDQMIATFGMNFDAQKKKNKKELGSLTKTKKWEKISQTSQEVDSQIRATPLNLLPK